MGGVWLVCLLLDWYGLGLPLDLYVCWVCLGDICVVDFGLVVACC